MSNIFEKPIYNIIVGIATNQYQSKISLGVAYDKK